MILSLGCRLPGALCLISIQVVLEIRCKTPFHYTSMDTASKEVTMNSIVAKYEYSLFTSFRESHPSTLHHRTHPRATNVLLVARSTFSYRRLTACDCSSDGAPVY